MNFAIGEPRAGEVQAFPSRDGPTADGVPNISRGVAREDVSRPKNGDSMARRRSAFPQQPDSSQAHAPCRGSLPDHEHGAAEPLQTEEPTTNGTRHAVDRRPGPRKVLKVISVDGASIAVEEHGVEHHDVKEHAVEEHAVEEQAVEEHAVEEHDVEEHDVEEQEHAVQEHAVEEHDVKEHDVEEQVHAVEEHAVEEHAVEEQEHAVQEHAVEDEEHAVEDEEHAVEDEEHAVEDEEHAVEDEEHAVEEHVVEEQQHAVEEASESEGSDLPSLEKIVESIPLPRVEIDSNLGDDTNKDERQEYSKEAGTCRHKRKLSNSPVLNHPRKKPKSNGMLEGPPSFLPIRFMIAIEGTTALFVWSSHLKRWHNSRSKKAWEIRDLAKSLVYVEVSEGPGRRGVGLTPSALGWTGLDDEGQTLCFDKTEIVDMISKHREGFFYSRDEFP
jgi:hypothetical protein